MLYHISNEVLIFVYSQCRNEPSCMKKLELLRLQKRIIVLAKIRNTGSVSVLASKLSVSDRTLKRIIKQVRDSGIPIYFDRRKESYRIDEF